MITKLNYSGMAAIRKILINLLSNDPILRYVEITYYKKIGINNCHLRTNAIALLTTNDSRQLICFSKRRIYG